MTQENKGLLSRLLQQHKELGISEQIDDEKFYLYSIIPDYKQAYRAIRMFKDEYLLDYINVEELGMHDEDVDERVIESNIVHNVKNFIMAFGRGFILCKHADKDYAGYIMQDFRQPMGVAT